MHLQIAIASGKGGTGKTTVATNLAATLADAGREVTFLDCDVEEPNGCLFLKPADPVEVDATVMMPVVDPDMCTNCGECADFCAYNALAVTPDRLLHFAALCHSCGGCAIVCPENAISAGSRSIGQIVSGNRGELDIAEGRMNIGELQAPPLIRQVKDRAGEAVTIIDAPPGTACAALEAVVDADFVLLVTEPTRFGAHDLNLAMDMLCEVERPFAVVINRDGIGTNDVRELCERRGVDILATLPNRREIAEVCARGELVIRQMPEYKERFIQLFEKVTTRAVQ